MIKQIKKFYKNSDLSTNNYAEYIGMTVFSTSSSQYNFTIQLPSYLTTGANYSITYIGFILDRTAVARDRKRSSIDTALYLSGGSSVVSVPFSQNVFGVDFNIFFGIGKYYFFNYQEPSLNFLITYTLSSFSANFYGSLTYNTYSSPYFGYSYAYFG